MKCCAIVNICLCKLSRSLAKCIHDFFTKLFAGTHLPLELDVTNSENIKSVIEEAIERYKRPPTITVNCAGITRDHFILKMEESDFDMVLKVNLKVRTAIEVIVCLILILFEHFKGTFLVMKHVVQRMVEHKVGGTIVNISSVTAKMGNMGQCRMKKRT